LPKQVNDSDTGRCATPRPSNKFSYYFYNRLERDWQVWGHVIVLRIDR